MIITIIMFIIFCDIISNLISILIFLKNVLIHSDSLQLYTMIMALKMCNMKYMHRWIVSFKVLVVCYCLLHFGGKIMYAVFSVGHFHKCWYQVYLMRIFSNKHIALCNSYGVLVFIVFLISNWYYIGSCKPPLRR